MERIQPAELCRPESRRKDVAASKNGSAQTLTLIVEFTTLTGLIAAILVLLVIAASATTLEPQHSICMLQSIADQGHRAHPSGVNGVR